MTLWLFIERWTRFDESVYTTSPRMKTVGTVSGVDLNKSWSHFQNPVVEL